MVRLSHYHFFFLRLFLRLLFAGVLSTMFNKKFEFIWKFKPIDLMIYLPLIFLLISLVCSTFLAVSSNRELKELNRQLDLIKVQENLELRNKVRSILERSSKLIDNVDSNKDSSLKLKDVLYKYYLSHLEIYEGGNRDAEVLTKEVRKSEHDKIEFMKKDLFKEIDLISRIDKRDPYKIDEMKDVMVSLREDKGLFKFLRTEYREGFSNDKDIYSSAIEQLYLKFRDIKIYIQKDIDENLNNLKDENIRKSYDAFTNEFHSFREECKKHLASAREDNSLLYKPSNDINVKSTEKGSEIKP